MNPTILKIQLIKLVYIYSLIEFHLNQINQI